MARVRVICISDTHGQHAALRVPDGDILIHAGDFMTYGNAPREIIDFNTWLGRQPHAHKIVIAGNHDRLFESHPIPARALITNASRCNRRRGHLAALCSGSQPSTQRPRLCFQNHYGGFRFSADAA
jgi:predicted phosphodiesterase